MSDPDRLLDELRAQLALAKRRQDEDVDHPSYMVVENSIVTGILTRFAELDEYLRGGGQPPTEWWHAPADCTHRCQQGRDCGGCGCPGCGYSA